MKRAYEDAAPEDGRRYLVDRMWPRGRTKEALAIISWRKELAPSVALCRWYGHDPARFPEFRTRYRGELRSRSEEVEALRSEARRAVVTLVFAARDAERSNAAVLAELLREPGQLGGGRRPRPTAHDGRAPARRNR